jgi:hypothetical protein
MNERDQQKGVSTEITPQDKLHRRLDSMDVATLIAGGCSFVSAIIMAKTFHDYGLSPEVYGSGILAAGSAISTAFFRVAGVSRKEEQRKLEKSLKSMKPPRDLTRSMY